MRKNTQEILAATQSTKIPDHKTISFIKNRKKDKKKKMFLKCELLAQLREHKSELSNLAQCAR